MRVHYDNEVDALYLRLGDETPGAVNLETISHDRTVGIEILNAPKKIDLITILSSSLELDKDLMTERTA